MLALPPAIAETMAVPPAVYGLLMYVSAFAVVAFGRRTFDPITVRRDRALGAP